MLLVGFMSSAKTSWKNPFCLSLLRKKVPLHSVATWRRMLDVGRARPTDPSYHGCCQLSVLGSMPFGTHVTDWKVGRIMSPQVAQASPSKLEGSLGSSVPRLLTPIACSLCHSASLLYKTIDDNVQTFFSRAPATVVTRP